MPIYEYQCKKCGEFEFMQRITDRKLTRCPTCRGKVTKLISNSSFQLKGSGWYVTDYARKETKSESGSKPDGKAESKSESTTESKAETKSETTTETKTEKSTTPSTKGTKATKTTEAAAA